MSADDPFQQPNHGKDNANWLGFVNTISKKEVYVKRVAHFFEWRKPKGHGDEQSDLIKNFNYHFGKLENDIIAKPYKPSTLRQWHSIFAQFWKFTGRGDINHFATGIPLLERMVSSWEKGYCPEQAKVFTRE